MKLVFMRTRYGREKKEMKTKEKRIQFFSLFPFGTGSGSGSTGAGLQYVPFFSFLSFFEQYKWNIKVVLQQKE